MFATYGIDSFFDDGTAVAFGKRVVVGIELALAADFAGGIVFSNVAGVAFVWIL